MKRLAWLALLAACGTLPTTSPDGGGEDASAPDAPDDNTVPSEASAQDVVAQDVAAADGSSSEASVDAAPEAACFVDASAVDAAVDLDAATSGWSQTLASQGTMFGAAVDSKGHVLLGGTSGPADSTQFLLMELDSSGSLLWKKQVGSGGSYMNHVARAVAFDAAGAMYAAGNTDDALDLGGGALGPGAFVVKCDASGNFVWEYGPFPNARFYALRVAPNGDVLAGGYLQGTANFGGGSLSSVSGSIDALLVEVSPCKDFLRSIIWGDAGWQEIEALAVDPSGNIILGGRFESSIDFGGGALKGPTAGSGSLNMFVAKLDSSASYLHQLDTGSGSNNNMMSSVDTNASGDIFVTGSLSGGDSMNLGGGKMIATATGGFDAFVGELDPSLGYVWGKHVGAAGNSGDMVAGTVAMPDPLGGVAITGFYGGADINFGQGAFPAGQGPFLARYDSAGNCVASWGAAPISGQHAGAHAGVFLTWPDFLTAGDSSASFTAPSGTVGPGPFAIRLAP